MTSPLNRSAQAGMGSGVEGRGEQGASFGPGYPASPEPGPVSALRAGIPSRGPADDLRAQLKPHMLARVEKGEHLIRWLWPRLAGSEDDRETTLVMLMAHLSDRYAEGIHDAGDVAEQVAAVRPTDRAGQAIAKGLRDMERQHRAHAITSLDEPPASGADAASAAETRSGSVEDEGPTPSGETPSQSPDPLSQTVAPSTEEKE